ncbi:MAG TPA: hypothetical protein VIP52_08560 [Candidatus Dormibacteraeota bacterium]|jgi:hypothetical protein
MGARAVAIDRLLGEGSLEGGVLPLDPVLDAEVEAQLAALETTLR